MISNSAVVVSWWYWFIFLANSFFLQHINVHICRLLDSGRYDTQKDFTVAKSLKVSSLSLFSPISLSLLSISLGSDATISSQWGGPLKVQQTLQKVWPWSSFVYLGCCISINNFRYLPDLSYLAPDCFHFSQKLHALGIEYLFS